MARKKTGGRRSGLFATTAPLAAFHVPDDLLDFLSAHWGWLTIATALIAAQVALIVALLASRRRRLEAERTTRESLETLQTLLDLVPAPIFQKDIEGRYQLCNKTFSEQILGLPREQIAGKTLRDLPEAVPEDLQRIYEEQDRRLIEQGTTQQYDAPVQCADGERRTYFLSKAVTRDKEGSATGIVGVMVDLTPLREAEAWKNAVFDNSAVGLLVVTGHRIIHETNPRFCEMFAASREELVGKSAEVLHVSRESYENFGESYWSRTSRGDVGVEYPFRRQDGSVFWGFISGRALDPEDLERGVIWVLTDITRRREAQQALRESEQRLRALIETMPDMVCFKDGEGRWLEANRAYLAFYGLEETDYRGRTAEELAPSAPASAREALRKTAELDEAAWRSGGVWRSERPQEEMGELKRDLDVIKAPTFGPSGKRSSLVVVARDITELRQAERNRLELERQIQHSQKLESLGVLAGGIAHDFNNLLMAILGHAELALCDLVSGSAARSSIQEIQTASRRAADLCRQMLAYSGKGKYVVESVDLSEVVGEMVHLLKTSVSKKAVLNQRLARNPPLIEADASQMRQVVMNLVINASEALEDRNGAIEVRVDAIRWPEDEPEETRDDYLGETLRPGPHVRLEVSDTGCGMDEATRARVFEPFFTTKFQGRGLGMSAVLGIVQGHHGAVRLTSAPGEGTTFRLLFPAAERPAAAPDAPPRDEPPPSGWSNDGATVLLVDDEPALRSLGVKILTRMGLRALTAEDGAQALDLYRRRRDEIDLVLLDLTMPEMDGAETFHALREINPSVKVVILSGYTERQVARRFSEASPSGFLTKPFTLTSLRTAISNTLG